MDVLARPGGEWKTVLIDDARAILRKTRERLESISRNKLEEMADVGENAAQKRRRTIDDDSSDIEDDENYVTIVENSHKRIRITVNIALLSLLSVPMLGHSSQVRELLLLFQ